MRRIPWMRATILTLCVSLAVTASAAARPHEASNSPGSQRTQAHATVIPLATGHGPAHDATEDQIDNARKAQRYWTPARIRAAVPADAAQSRKPASKAPPGAGLTRKRSLASAPSRQVPEGIATVGVFLIRTTDGSPTPDQFCTASAVASPTKNLVITAAHCLNGDHRHRDFAFVPGYRTGTSTAGQTGEAPYGIFPAQEDKTWIDARYRASAPDDDVDFAFLSVGPNARGQLLEDAVGRGNELTSVPTGKLARKAVTLVGYPGGQKTPLQCTNDTTAFQGRFMEIKCEGFRTGVSGGPFLEDFDGRRGSLVGVIGGYKTGGLYDHTSYTSQFDEDTLRLYRQAVTGMPSGPDPGTGTGTSMGSAGTWTHARGMTTGRFHTASVRNNVSDLIVRWSDGELSLYPGNGAYGFGKDIQLVKDKAWQQAAVITAGDFTGDTNYDLLVRWTDGRLTLYKDVNESTKLTHKVELKGPNDTWTHASTMAAGRFGGGNTRSDDLVVTWTDGEVTLYSNVDAKGLHAEKQLVTPPDTTWPHARDIAAGDFRPETGDQDLFVRWSDGEATAYENIAAETFGREHRLLPAKSPWREVLLATAGSFGGPTRQNDLIALWPGGKLTLHPDTTSTSLPAERVLVPQ
ncbi:trypsin-like peptidase domain-containing protein [Streptomyces decoyicus]|uniref:trypsin-like serine peptidase n=1 Tax=Streptomyces decoyicus TaxID=249567 RepID=UPI0034119B17